MNDAIDRYEIILAGTGGQGMVLAGLILAQAAAIYDGKNAVQSQSYGPEARGGSSKAEVIISSIEIDYPRVISADLLLCMSQEACDKFYYDLKRDGLLILDSTFVERSPTSRAISLPITRIALEATGRDITASMVALGLICGLSKVVSREAMEKVIRERVPNGTEKMNLDALGAGLEHASRLMARLVAFDSKE